MNPLGKFLLKIASILLFVISVCISSIVPQSAYPATSEEKPESIVLPVAILGEVSDIRRKILQNTLNETISTKFRIVPQERFEKAQEAAFQELDYEECTEDQCIMLIQEMLQVEHLFQLEVIAEGQMVQLSLKLVTLYEKKNKTDLCEQCTTRQLIDSVSQLTLSLLEEIDTTEVDVVYTPPAEIEKKEIPKPKKVEPKVEVEKPKPAARQKQDAGVEGVRDDSIAGKSTKKEPQKEKPIIVAKEPEPKKGIVVKESNNFRIRALVGSSSSDSISVASNVISVSWSGFGLGSSNLSYKSESSTDTYDMTASFYDLSYTFGEEWSFGVALGLMGNGNGKMSSSTSSYESSQASGSYYSATVGSTFAGFEGLLGFQSISLKYDQLTNNVDRTVLKTPFEVKGGLMLVGIGVLF
jgi:hypothetical protein